jgi:prevent-host-death family protein
MEKIIGTTDLQRNFKAVFDEVAKEKIPYILTRGSRPEAVLVPYTEYQRLQQLQEKEVLRRVETLLTRLADQNARYDAAEVAADVEAALNEVRAGYDD